MDEKRLFNEIMLRIKTEQRKAIVRRKIAIFSFVLVVSLSGFIPALGMAWTDLADSGFVQLFSLAFSDTKIMMTLLAKLSFVFIGVIADNWFDGSWDFFACTFGLT